MILIVTQNLHARNNDTRHTGIFVNGFVRQGKVEFDRRGGGGFDGKGAETQKIGDASNQHQVGTRQQLVPRQVNNQRSDAGGR